MMKRTWKSWCSGLLLGWWLRVVGCQRTKTMKPYDRRLPSSSKTISTLATPPLPAKKGTRPSNLQQISPNLLSPPKNIPNLISSPPPNMLYFCSSIEQTNPSIFGKIWPINWGSRATPQKHHFLPVLSEQKTETQPKVSTASILRTMTLWPGKVGMVKQPFRRLSDAQRLGKNKVTLNHLVGIFDFWLIQFIVGYKDVLCKRLPELLQVIMMMIRPINRVCNECPS